jgi:hypothetical protein
LLSFGAEYFVFSLLSKNLKIKIYRTVILSVVLYGCETWSLTLREERRPRVFENRVLWRTFRAERDEITREKEHGTHCVRIGCCGEHLGLRGTR